VSLGIEISPPIASAEIKDKLRFDRASQTFAATLVEPVLSE
jgi:hypothetical protein